MNTIVLDTEKEDSNMVINQLRQKLNAGGHLTVPDSLLNR